MLSFFYYESVKKDRLKIIVKELVLLLLQVIFSNVKMFENGVGAGLAFAFARLFFGDNLLTTTAGFAVSKLVLFENLNGLLVAGYQIVLLTLYYFAKEVLKNKKPLMVAILFICFSNLLEFYLALESLSFLISFAVQFLASVLIFLFFVMIFQSYKNKFVLFRFSESDYLKLSCMIFLISLGLFCFEWVASFAGFFVLVFFSMLFAKVLPSDKFFVCLLVGAAGALFATNNLNFLLFTVLFIVMIIQFKELNKYFFALTSLCFLTALVFLMKLFDLAIIISIVAGVFVFVCLPSKWLTFLLELFVFEGQNIISQNVQQKRIDDIKSKLLLMSGTFSAMQRDFKYLLVGKIDREKASAELCQDVINKCCLTCENYKMCYMENINKRKMFESLMLKAIEKKGISMADMSNGAGVYCFKSAIVANEVNQTAKLFLKYESAMKNEDSSKLMIASELGNFADIFKNFAGFLSNKFKPNMKASKEIKEKLISVLVDAKEVLLLENEMGVEQISLIAANEQILKREVLSVMQKQTKLKLKLKSVVHLKESGLALATFVPDSNIRIEFAVTTKAKEQKNGDNVVVTKLSENRFFIAIADGMGHGEEANRISKMVLSLIRSMFEVGLDDNLIVESVNKLLIPAGLDSFSTLDACVIDTKAGVCTFIKMGSSVSVIKHQSTSEIVSSHSLPIGIVQNIKPTIVKKNIFAGDMIFLASDGVVDSFLSVDDFKSFVNDSKIYNLQKFTDDVVFEGQALNAKHIDDMTIIGINLLKK